MAEFDYNTSTSRAYKYFYIRRAAGVEGLCHTAPYTRATGHNIIMRHFTQASSLIRSGYSQAFAISMSDGRRITRHFAYY